MVKKRDYQPKDITELNDMYGYGEKGIGGIDWKKRSQYESFALGEITPTYEEIVKKIFSKLGKVEKIKEKSSKSSDFVIESRKLLIEVKSLNMSEPIIDNRIRSEQWTFNKVMYAINQILEKENDKVYSRFRKGGAIIYSMIFRLFTGFNKMLDETLVKKCPILDNELAFVVFIPEPVGIYDINRKPKKYPTVFYVKGKSMADEFRRVFQDSMYKIIQNN